MFLELCEILLRQVEILHLNGYQDMLVNVDPETGSQMGKVVYPMRTWTRRPETRLRTQIDMHLLKKCAKIFV